MKVYKPYKTSACFINSIYHIYIWPLGKKQDVAIQKENWKIEALTLLKRSVASHSNGASIIRPLKMR